MQQQLPLSLSCVAIAARVQAVPVAANQDETYRIYAEVAERLCEIADRDGDRKMCLWLSRTAELARRSKKALRLYLTLQSGDISSLTASYAELAAHSGQSKQAKHLELQATLAEIAQAFPELGEAIAQLRQLCKHGEVEQPATPHAY